MRYETLQEHEHYEFEAGAASEFQNCFTEAQSKVSQIAFEQAALIHRARTLGLWVVVEVSAYYCKATDALAGHYEHFICAFPTREAADEKIQKLYSKLSAYDSGDYNYSVIHP